MAVTGFWPVFKNLKATLDYADNPDKTTAPEYLDEDLYAALRYAENDDKTDRKVFVGGINCSAQNAYAEMIAVQRRFGLRGKVVGYHGIQSFREDEVTPEQAFAIGKATARRMWGARYQVLVTVHLNTDNVHCHFVVNPVSFRDGSKFRNKIGDHKELRKISDEICREHGLSVLENSDFYSKGKKKEYWVHKAGKQSRRDMLRRDVEEALAKCGSFREVEYYLRCLGYRFQRDSHYAPPLLSSSTAGSALSASTALGHNTAEKPSGSDALKISGSRSCTATPIHSENERRCWLSSTICGKRREKIPLRCCSRFSLNC